MICLIWERWSIRDRARLHSVWDLVGNVWDIKVTRSQQLLDTRPGVEAGEEHESPAVTDGMAAARPPRLQLRSSSRYLLYSPEQS